MYSDIYPEGVDSLNSRQKEDLETSFCEWINSHFDMEDLSPINELVEALEEDTFFDIAYRWYNSSSNRYN